MALVYDLEIKNAVPKPDTVPEIGIQYCKGWDDKGSMGISVLCAYDTDTQQMHAFTDANYREFAAMCEAATLLVGFNNIAFDNEVLRCAWGINLPKSKCYDLLREIWLGLGLGLEFNAETHGSYGLGKMAQANFKTDKTFNGADAPMLWQRGGFANAAQLIAYCMNDVLLTARLYETQRISGGLRLPNGDYLRLGKSLWEQEAGMTAQVAA